MGHVCPGCGYVYDERKGDPHNGYPAGTAWTLIPDDWCCPECAVREKPDFTPSDGRGQRRSYDARTA